MMSAICMRTYTDLEQDLSLFDLRLGSFSGSIVAVSYGPEAGSINVPLGIKTVAAGHLVWYDMSDEDTSDEDTYGLVTHMLWFGGGLLN
uniref:Uncharacterized protein n=1 Tax=Timema shepardi TaxID=629360 RepID=A0A7R9AW86_TIMSH|nr:unnamed protein product [Timema shepardi]